MSFHYKIYGLQLSSNREISLLEETGYTAADLSLSIQPGTCVFPELVWEQVQTADLKKRRSIKFYLGVSESGIFSKTEYLTPEGYICFVLSPDKNEMWISYDEKVPAANLESYFVGPIMGGVLRLRGVLCLHASVIEIDGKAIAFLGSKRSGKSTTAATFASMGHRVLADDLGVITQHEGNFYMQSGYSRLRLRQKTVEVIHPEHLASLPLVYSFGDSRYATLDERFCGQALPLAAVYILTLNDTNQELITPVGLAESLVILGQNTFGNHVITPETRKQEFELLCHLAKETPVNRLHIVYDIENINRQYNAVFNNYHSLHNELK